MLLNSDKAHLLNYIHLHYNFCVSCFIDYNCLLPMMGALKSYYKRLLPLLHRNELFQFLYLK